MNGVNIYIYIYIFWRGEWSRINVVSFKKKNKSNIV